MRLDQFSFLVFVEVVVGTELPLIQLAGELSPVDLVEIEDFVGFERSCNAKAFGNVLGLHISTWQIFRPLGDKEVPPLPIFLLPQVKRAGIRTVIKVELLILFLRVIVEICISWWLPVIC